jgi:hypothetical protein
MGGFIEPFFLTGLPSPVSIVEDYLLISLFMGDVLSSLFLSISPTDFFSS